MPSSPAETQQALQQAQARINAALALLSPEARMTFQSQDRYIAALIKALTA